MKEDTSSALKTFIDNKAPASQMLADIHGYIAVTAWKKIPAANTPSGDELKLSNILRDLYLVKKKGVTSKAHPKQIPRSYRAYFEEITGKKSDRLKAHIIRRATNFASPWFAKKAFDSVGWWKSEGCGKESILSNNMKQFDELHQKNEDSAPAEDKLGHYVDAFLKMLETEMP